MFKKRNLKGQNFAQEMGAVGTAHRLSSTDDTDEPVIQKKFKTATGSKFSTKEQTDEYEKLANEYQDDLTFKARAELITKDSGNAFASREIDTDEAHDARAIKLKQIQRTKDIKAGKVDTKFYAGESGYAVYAEKSESDIAKSKITGSLGPIRAPSNIRATVRIDYNPSLCKDWHDTGYCGFGDSCIYIHDRGDYKSGWELEKEWEAEQASKAKRYTVTSGGYQGEEEGEEEEEEEGPPRKCQICEEKFKSPVTTSCKHYFCERCIFEEFRKSKSCPVCSRPLNGNFNVAHDVIARDKAEGGQDKVKNKKKEGRIVLGQVDESERIARQNKGGSDDEEGGGLEGVDFGGEEESEEDKDEDKGKKARKASDDEEALRKINEDFKAQKNKKKKFDIQSDWLYE